MGLPTKLSRAARVENGAAIFEAKASLASLEKAAGIGRKIIYSGAAKNSAVTLAVSLSAPIVALLAASGSTGYENVPSPTSKPLSVGSLTSEADFRTLGKGRAPAPGRGGQRQEGAFQTGPPLPLLAFPAEGALEKGVPALGEKGGEGFFLPSRWTGIRGTGSGIRASAAAI